MRARDEQVRARALALLARAADDAATRAAHGATGAGAAGDRQRPVPSTRRDGVGRDGGEGFDDRDASDDRADLADRGARGGRGRRGERGRRARRRAADDGSGVPADRSDRAGRGSHPPLVALPTTLRVALADVSWAAVGGVALVLLVVAVVVGVRVAAARHAAEPVPVGVRSSASGGVEAGSRRSTAAAPSGSMSPGALPSGTGTATTVGMGSTAQPTPSIVVVDVAGAVRSPGVQRLSSGARVVDALARAGGVTPDADLSGVNRARVLADGELLRVPRRGEQPPVVASGPPAGGGAAAATAPGSAAGIAPSAPVDLNTADAAALDTLPGVGPAIAGRILAWRTEHGRFSSVDELGEVSGIGDTLLQRLRPLVRVGP